MNLKLKRFFIFLVGSLGVALANAIVVKANLGNTAWGIAAINIIKNNPTISFGLAIGFLNVFIFIVCRIVERKYRPLMDTVGLILSLFFGVVIAFFEKMLIPIEPTTYVGKMMFLVLGIIFMAYTIVVYLKANFFKFPFDDSLVVFGDNIFKGNYALGSYLGMGIASVIAIAFGLLSGGIIGFNIYTIIIVVVFGPIINFFFKHTKWVDKFLELDK